MSGFTQSGLLGFTSCKAEEPVDDMELQKKEKEKDEKHIWNLFSENGKIRGTY